MEHSNYLQPLDTDLRGEQWISGHAREHMQQRCIPVLIVYWLSSFGTKRHLSGNMEIYYFDRKSRKRLRQYVGGIVMKRMAKLLDTYLIMHNGVVVSVGHRYQKSMRRT